MVHYSSFILRIWVNPQGGLHGQVVHVATQEKRHFRSMDRMVQFIMEHLAPVEILKNGPARPQGIGLPSGDVELGDWDE